MSRVLLVHWKASEISERAMVLEKAGFVVEGYSSTDGMELRKLRERPPTAFVIDLTRLPSHGRAVAVALRQAKSTRHVPMVFVGGEPEKVERTRKELPDASYARWEKIVPALKKAIASPPKEIHVPGTMAGYSGTPLPKKLGIEGDRSVLLLGAPDGFEKAIGASAGDSRIRRDRRGRADVVMLFVASRKELDRKLPGAIRAMSEGGGLWIAWPKKASGAGSDLGESLVRRAGLDAGIVDYKVCAIDAMWSGLKFARRKPAGKKATKRG